MPTVDLDAARAARREAKGEDIIVRFGGNDFTMPPELPFEVVEVLGDIRDAGEDAPRMANAIFQMFQILLGDQFETFKAARPSMDDLNAMLEGVMAEYGVTLGEQEASADS
jgi:hypothetical protein